MTKTNIFRTCMVTILFALCFNLISVTMAAAGCGDCNNPPTTSGDAEYPCCWQTKDAKPTIVATYSEGMDTIDSEHSVTLSINGSCPPYTWTMTSAGYSLTDNDDGKKTLSVVSGTCGTSFDIYATVTVTNACGTTTIDIRHAGGYWVGVTSSGSLDYKKYETTKTIGKYQYRSCVGVSPVQPSFFSLPIPAADDETACNTFKSSYFPSEISATAKKVWKETWEESGLGTMAYCTNDEPGVGSWLILNACGLNSLQYITWNISVYEWKCTPY